MEQDYNLAVGILTRVVISHWLPNSHDWNLGWLTFAAQELIPIEFSNILSSIENSWGNKVQINWSTTHTQAFISHLLPSSRDWYFADSLPTTDLIPIEFSNILSSIEKRWEIVTIEQGPN